MRRDGGLNSSGVAPTPMHPAATGQLWGLHQGQRLSSHVGQLQGRPRCATVVSNLQGGDAYPPRVESEAER